MKKIVSCKLKQFQKDKKFSFLYIRILYNMSQAYMYILSKVEIKGRKKKSEGNDVKWIFSTQYIPVRNTLKLTK